MKPTFYEFFAGGGMARAGLGAGWECLFANDIDPKKAESYIANWGEREFRLADVHDVSAKELVGQADLAWASFPCQDLSLAGNGEGLDGQRSGAFWGFYDIIHGLKLRGRAPKLLVLENVVGAVTSKNGRDFASICQALKSLSYLYGALIIDAVHFVPQSRPRLFIVAIRSDLDVAIQASAAEPTSQWTSGALFESFSRLRPDLRKSWRWWQLPSPPTRNEALTDLIIDDPHDVQWHTKAETELLLSMMTPIHLAKVAEAKRQARKTVGTIYKRTRRDEFGKKTREQRFVLTMSLVVCGRREAAPVVRR